MSDEQSEVSKSNLNQLDVIDDSVEEINNELGSELSSRLNEYLDTMYSRQDNEVKETATQEIGSITVTDDINSSIPVRSTDIQIDIDDNQNLENVVIVEDLQIDNNQELTDLDNKTEDVKTENRIFDRLDTLFGDIDSDDVEFDIKDLKNIDFVQGINRAQLSPSINIDSNNDISNEHREAIQVTEPIPEAIITNESLPKIDKPSVKTEDSLKSDYQKYLDEVEKFGINPADIDHLKRLESLGLSQEVLDRITNAVVEGQLKGNDLAKLSNTYFVIKGADGASEKLAALFNSVIARTSSINKPQLANEVKHLDATSSKAIPGTSDSNSTIQGVSVRQTFKNLASAIAQRAFLSEDQKFEKKLGVTTDLIDEIDSLVRKVESSDMGESAKQLLSTSIPKETRLKITGAMKTVDDDQNIRKLGKKLKRLLSETVNLGSLARDDASMSVYSGQYQDRVKEFLSSIENRLDGIADEHGKPFDEIIDEMVKRVVDAINRVVSRFMAKVSQDSTKDIDMVN